MIRRRYQRVRARLGGGVWLLMLALALLLATYLNPRVILDRVHFRYLAVVDITQSMNVRDVGAHRGTPVTRLELAKQALRETVERLPCDSELGIGIFTQHRTLMLLSPVEVCANYNELLALVDEINWRMAWDARSEVAKGLYSSVAVAEAVGAATRVMFFTDGHEAPPVNPQYKPPFSGTPGRIRGLVVGVGGDTPMPIPKFDLHGDERGHWRADEVLQVDTYSLGRGMAQGDQLVGVEIGDVARRIASGTEHLSSLRESYLIETATAIGLDYHRLRTSNALFDALSAPPLGIIKPSPVDLRWLYVALALLLLVITYLADIPALRGRSQKRRGSG